MSEATTSTPPDTTGELCERHSLVREASPRPTNHHHEGTMRARTERRAREADRMRQLRQASQPEPESEEEPRQRAEQRDDEAEDVDPSEAA